MKKNLALVMAVMLGLGSIATLSAKEPESRRGRGRGENEVRSGSASGSNRATRQSKVQGTVLAVNLSTGQVTIRTRNGQTVTVVATAATKVERNGLHASLIAIQVGDRGQATYDRNFGASKIESIGP